MTRWLFPQKMCKHRLYSDVMFYIIVCVESLGHVQLFVSPWTVAQQVSLSMGILQARILEWVSMSSSRGSSQPSDRTQVFCIAVEFFTVWATLI